MTNIKSGHTIIERKYYTEKVLPYMQKPLAKVFTGQRRVGKSYLLFQIMDVLRKKEPDAHIIYINMEDMQFSALQDGEKLYQYILDRLKQGSFNYIFIDEIQEVAGFEKAVRSLLLNPENDVYITGSNAQLLSGELATLLAGRTIEITVHSLSFSEFLIFHSLNDDEQSLELYLKYGGMPYLRNLELNDELVFEYLKNIYNTVVYRDVVARNNIRSTSFLEQLIHYLADATGSLFSSKKISDYLKSQKVNMAHNQVNTFIHHLVNAFLVQEVGRYDIKGKRIFETGAKYYFEDTGLRNSITGYRSADLEKLTENAVFNHLDYHGFKVFVGEIEGKEIDFIGEKNGERIYIQACMQIDSEKTSEREFSPLLAVPDQYPKIVVSLYGKSRNSIGGVAHISLHEFLLKIW
jgi:predicted AAA+ superfamily ATPase